MLLDQAVNDFILSCEADGLSPATVKWYRSILGVWLLKSGGCELTALDVQAMRSYIVLLRERVAYLDAPQKPASKRKLAGASVDSHITALHAFWAWCEREYGIPNPMAGIRHPKRRNEEPKAITPRDFVKLVKATGQFSQKAGVRDRALLVFLADSGARLSEVVTLTLDNLDVNAGRALVYGKGCKTRVVVFTRMTARFLLAWLAVRRSRSDKVFTSVNCPFEGLSSNGIEQILKRLKHQAKVTGRANPHSFRHAFAREYLKNGGDMVTLARLLGHADVNTTASAYAIFSQDELAELHEKYSPLKGMLK